MPMQRSLYPENWEVIARSVKRAANWRCENCDRPCRMPGEDLTTFTRRIQGERWGDLDWANHTAISTICDAPQRFTLTTAHLDQNPANSDRSNLKALCAPCHLAYDRPFREHNRQRKRERSGQLALDMKKAIAE